MDEQGTEVSFARRIRQLAAERPDDDLAYWHIGQDGGEQGAAMMPPALVHRWAKLIGAERIIMAYGMTEGLGLTALRGDEWMSHQGSVGRGRRVHAIIEPADPAVPPPAEEMRAYAKGRLAPYKVPKTVEIVDSIPRSAATKVNRGALRAARGG